MKIQLTLEEELMLNMAILRSQNPLPRTTSAGDCISELWDVGTCHKYHETLTQLAFMNFLTISWVTDGLGKLRNYRINNAGRHALWLHNREKEKEVKNETV